MHGRLLRSLRFDDDDYGEHVYSAVERILRDSDNVGICLRHPKVKAWMQTNEPELYAELADDPTFVAPFHPTTPNPGQIVERALADADALLASPGGAVSAVDRVHTALHGYLKTACDEASLGYPADFSVTKLFKIVRTFVGIVGGY